MKSAHKSKALFLIVWLLFNAFAFETLIAQPVDTVQAKLVAKNFFADRLSRSRQVNIKGITFQNLEISLVHQETESLSINSLQKSTQALPLYYIFNVKDKNGFVIVSADQRIPAILGYSYSGAFSENNKPPAFEEWMNNYREQIIYVIKNNITPNSEISNEWKNYSSTLESKNSEALSELLPLLTTTWDQGCYYNNFCPSDSRGQCNKVWAGCVAVAMAQIMKYWNYPATNNIIPGYNDPLNYNDDGTSIANSAYGFQPDVGVTTYNWSQMTNSLTSSSSSTQIDAVSKIIYHCGVAVQMNYGPSGSSAGIPVPEWINYFNYSSGIQSIRKSNYSTSAWETLIKNELDNIRPVWYRGETATGAGHAFVCDGYQNTNYFHFNWGWGGYEDGYFYLDNLNPGYVFNNYQYAVIGISPKPNLTYHANYNSLSVAGNLISLSLRVINNSNVSASESYVSYYLSADNNITTSDYKIGESHVPSLRDGEYSDQSLSVDVASAYPGIPPGTYYVGYIIDYQNSINEFNENDNIFYWSAPRVTTSNLIVTSPNGGEVWQAGSIHNITWTSSGNSGTVRLEYSTNNGSSWTTILTSTPDDGSQPWTVPNTPSTTCLVRVSDTDGIPNDISNAVFSISPLPTNSLVAYYPFNGNANDNSTYGNNGIVNGVTFTSDRFGNPNAAVSFDGINDYINCGNNSSINPANAISISCWIKSDELNNVRIISKWGVNSGYELDVANHLLRFILNQTANVTCDVSQNEGKWTFITGTWDGSNVHLYVNGVLQSSSFQAPPLTSSPNNLLIGEMSGLPGYYFNGTIDDIRLYNIALSESEISTLYHEGGWPYATVPTLTTTLISSLTQNSAQSGGNISDNGGSAITARGVCWSSSPDPKVNLVTKTVDGTGSGSFTSSVTGLAVGTTYYIRAYATNNIGTSYGDNVIFKTYNSDAIIDIDGNYYNVVTIGSQVWMAENLKTIHYKDGTSIPLVTDNALWKSLTTPGYCWYNNDAVTNKNVYGALYNWYTVNTGKLCLTGWHIPTDGEWTTLIDYLGGYDIAGGKLKEAGTIHWMSPNTGATNESGFTALPGGFRHPSDGNFGNLTGSEDWWSSTEFSTTEGWLHEVQFIDGRVNHGYYYKQIGLSIRCLKDVIQTLSVTSPNGGESWQVGSIHNITWTSVGNSGTVRIEYSPNNGTSWTTILASTPDDGSESWTVPNTPSTTCLVRVSDTDGSPVDISNAVFSITTSGCYNETFTAASGTVTDNSGASDYLNNMSCDKLIQPTGGGTITLTFTAFNTESGFDFVSVYNGTTTTAPLLGTFSGSSLPPVLTANSGSMLIRFTTDVSVTAAGWSANYTSVIPQPIITVTSPNGGESWQVGSIHNITWTSVGNSGTVRIEYSPNNGTSWTTILASTPDDGSESWTVPNTPSTTCLVRVSDTDGSPVDISNAVFSITTSGCYNETFTAASGTVTDNSGASDYLNNMSCDKLIQPTGGGTITLTFTAFNTESGFDFVSVYNGTTTTAPLLGTFSGSSLPPVLTANSGSMLIRFTTDVSVTAAGWSANYTSVIPQPIITVTSPNGGESWQVGSIHNITWTSVGNSGTVRIEYSPNNGTSWTTILASTPDDGSESWTVPNTPSTTCLVRVSDTDGSPVDISNAVFSITTSGCYNETFTAASGTVTDNSGASDYLNNMSCDKLIQPTGGGTITLTFTAFNTESGFDFVSVYNGTTTTAPLLGTFSGSSLPPVLTANSGSMLIRFTTDVSVTAAGWSANYTSVIPQPIITVTSPNGGESWQVGSIHNITWTSVGNSGTVRIEYSPNNGTSWTTILASTPDDGSESWTVPNTPSTTCLVRVSDTDGSPVDISNAVFSITTSGCYNETFTAASGTVTDNSGALDYQNNMTCDKLIQPSGGGTITLTFTAFNTESGYDFVSVYNGTTTSAPLLGTFSGSTLPPVLTANSGSMLIRFTTDVSVTAAGWSANYTSVIPQPIITVTSPNGGESWQVGSIHNITWTTSPANSGTVRIEYSTNNGTSWTTILASTPDDGSESWTVPNTPSTTCLVRVSDTDGSPVDISNAVFSITTTGCYNETFTAASGTVTDNSGALDYQNNMTCDKLIQPSGGGTITLTFTAFNTESGYDFVSVYNGTTTSAPLLGTFSGSTLPPVLTANSGSMLIRFTTDVSVTAAGWSANYTSVIPQPIITVTSPNGGESWQVGSIHNITWTTSPANSGTVRIEYSPNNGTSWTTILSSTPDDGSESWTVPNTPSTTCLVRVSDTDGSPVDISNAVFSITTTGCYNETFTAASGTVTDNSGALDYQNNMTCDKLIQPSGGGTITLTFTAFNTESGYDFVSVYNGTTTSSPLLGTFSGSTLPPVLTANSGSMLIRFTTDVSVTAAGWSANYTSGVPPATMTVTLPNGGEIWQVGTIQNITWTSSGTSGTVKIEYSTNNGTNWTNVIASTPDDGSQSWTVPNTPSTACLVRVSDTDGSPVDVSNAVFSIVPVSGVCVNETFTTASGTVTDNSGASDYQNNMTCEKLIQISGLGTITLTFTAFNTEAWYDIVKVYAGSTTSAPLLGSFSGTSLPPVLTSAAGSMLIRFTSDGSVVAAGWSATYTTNISGGAISSNSVFGEAKTTDQVIKKEILPDNDIIAYPNPTSGILTIETCFTDEEIFTIDLINSSGQVILNQTMRVIGGKFDINLSSVSYGIYLLKVKTEKTVKYLRIIKN